MRFFIIVFSLLLVFPAQANTMPVHEWLEKTQKEAVAAGISQEIYTAALKDFKPIPRIIELDKKQPEFTKTFAEYLDSVVPKSRIQKANEAARKHAALLDKVSAAYGVQKQYIVALWGVESNFGERMGDYNIPHALATLAYDGRRAEFFKKELFDSLKILQEQGIAPATMKGSWAGAMGQTQFMPSSYLAYAADFNKDGKKDIWGTQEDVFASVANYLKNMGWNDKESWGRRVKLPKGFDVSLAGLDKDKAKDLSAWSKLGVVSYNGSPLPEVTMESWLILPNKNTEYAYLVYNNYQRIMRWNRSTYFATAVGTLADAIR